MEKLSTQQLDTQNTQLNIEKSQSKENSTLVETELINNTPFHIVKQKEKWFITMGNHKITHEYNTKEEAIERLHIDKWFILMTVITIITEAINKGNTHNVDN